MKALSLKLDEHILADTEEIVKDLGLSRNAYFNQAISLYNKIQHRKQLRTQLVQESHAVYRSSMDILSEFETLDLNEIIDTEEI